MILLEVDRESHVSLSSREGNLKERGLASWPE